MSDTQRLDGIGIAGGLMKRGLTSFQRDIDCISRAIYLIEAIYHATLTLKLVMIGHSLAHNTPRIEGRTSAVTVRSIRVIERSEVQG